MAIKNLLFYKEMLNQSLMDGVITKDEHALLDNIRENYGIYEEHFKLAMEDGIISDEETDDLRRMRKEIYKKALETAFHDSVITDDELKILETLKSSVDLPDNILREVEECVTKR